MSTIAERLLAVRERIDRAARAAGRDPGEVRLVAVSKTKPPGAIREAYLAGHRDFGENYAQELAEKARLLADLPALRWHFVGHLQKNKAKLVAPHAHVVHTVDGAGLAAELAKRVTAAGHGRLDVMIEINVGLEAQKQGIPPGEAGELARVIGESPALRLVGLMTMAPAGDLDVARRVFERVRALRSELALDQITELSMGMTDDLEIAVACGATMVRVGTAIFGARGGPVG